MTTEFDIGDEVWYGYPEPRKGNITRIYITASGVSYEINNSSEWQIVGKTAKEAKRRAIEADLASHERYIAKLKKDLEELEG